MAVLDYEPFVPSVDVCGICGDCYCDGISCVSSLDPDDLKDQEAIEQLQTWVRAGRALLVATDLMVSAGYARGLPSGDPNPQEPTARRQGSEG